MLPQQIRQELFWDIDNPDIDKNKRLIIDRILQLGNLEELHFIFNYYGKDKISEEVKQIAYLDPKTISFVVNYLEIKKEDLRCYIKKQSTHQHWS